jgi:hypothetical protein
LPHGHQSGAALERHAVAGDAEPKESGGQQRKQLCSRPTNVSTNVV